MSMRVTKWMRLLEGMWNEVTIWRGNECGHTDDEDDGSTSSASLQRNIASDLTRPKPSKLGVITPTATLQNISAQIQFP
ncbi:hypothetical protein FOMPIDRAFT_1025303, partial [Fomitopsis schrenkii]